MMIQMVIMFLTIIWVTGGVISVLKLEKLVSYANKHGSDLFGRNYQSLLALFADISFFNELFSGKKILQHSNFELVAQLQKVRTLFRTVIFISIASQALVIINAAMINK